MAPSDRLPTSSTSVSLPLVDIIYKLAHECVKGKHSGDINDSNNHIQIKTDPNSYLNRRLSPGSQMIICRAQFSWANYSGDLSGVYDRVEDTLLSTKLLKNTLHNDAGTNSAISKATITLFKERTQNGTLVENGGRYLRLDLEFTGSPAHSAKVWGKRVDTSGDIQFSREEKQRLGIEGRKWRWESD